MSLFVPVEWRKKLCQKQRSTYSPPFGRKVMDNFSAPRTWSRTEAAALICKVLSLLIMNFASTQSVTSVLADANEWTLDHLSIFQYTLMSIVHEVSLIPRRFLSYFIFWQFMIIESKLLGHVARSDKSYFCIMHKGSIFGRRLYRIKFPLVSLFWIYYDWFIMFLYRHYS